MGDRKLLTIQFGTFTALPIIISEIFFQVSWARERERERGRRGQKIIDNPIWSFLPLSPAPTHLNSRNVFDLLNVKVNRKTWNCYLLKVLNLRLMFSYSNSSSTNKNVISYKAHSIVIIVLFGNYIERFPPLLISHLKSGNVFWRIDYLVLAHQRSPSLSVHASNVFPVLYCPFSSILQSLLFLFSSFPNQTTNVFPISIVPSPPPIYLQCQ